MTMAMAKADTPPEWTAPERFPPDAAALSDSLSEIVRAAGGDWGKARPAVLKALKATRAAILDDAERFLLEEGSGLACARRISAGQDAIVTAAAHLAARHVYRVDNRSSGERIAILATGGYGRGTLAPGSDIDLLFLFPYKQTPWVENIVETTLYLLWDMGLKVGHATRSVDECIRQARADMTIRTALLEARLVTGQDELADALFERFDTAVMRGTAPEFIAAKLAERDTRHRKQGTSRYLVEPNVKEGKGGLRDLDTLFWIAKYAFRVRTTAGLVKAGVFSAAETRRFRKCADFLWAVRCHLHFVTKRAEERLSFDVQREIAARLGYTSRSGLSDVERFMKHYFLTAKDVGDLTRILCAALEDEHVKKPPRLDRFLSPLVEMRRRRRLPSTDFVIDRYRINMADPEVFARDPVNIIRIFRLAQKHDLDLHPEAMRAIRRSLRRVDHAVRASQEANRLFLEVLTARGDPSVVLRHMNETGVLGRFLPDFGKVVAMMQFNMYHHYTVDEHLIRAVGILAAIDQGRAREAHPLATELMKTVSNRRVLYVAMLLHDIAKGRPEDHSQAGAAIARSLCPRLGMSASETETVAWLVENHLVMSITAQSRDLSDPKTIRDFAAVTQSPERLKLLEILTEADIDAVGPGTWNGWKSQLLNVLYSETELVLTAGHSRMSRDQRLAAARERFRAALEGKPKAEVERALARHADAYWLRVALDDKLYHHALLQEAEAAGAAVWTGVRVEPEKDVTEITLIAPDVHGLLAIVARACAVAGANIVFAEIFTTTDGVVVDTFAISREFESSEDELRRARRVSELITRAIEENARLPEIRERRLGPAPAETFSPENDVVVSNDWSDRYTAIEVSGLDRPGLFHDVTRKIADLGLNIRSARLATFGERAVDVFYVTNGTGGKIAHPASRAKIRRALLSARKGGTAAAARD